MNTTLNPPALVHDQAPGNRMIANAAQFAARRSVL